MSETTPQPGTIEFNGRRYMTDAKGALVPIDLVKPADKLIDETVRKVMDFARSLSAQIARFKGHTFDDLGSLQDLIAQEYGIELGGRKGNVTFTSYDGTMKIQIAVADRLEFGPELQAAKIQVDACLAEWSAESRDELVAIVNRAFSVDKEGQINRAELFSLLRVDIADPRWREAMRAVRDSIRIIGARLYVRFYERPRPDAAWQAVTIDLASA